MASRVKGPSGVGVLLRGRGHGDKRGVGGAGAGSGRSNVPGMAWGRALVSPLGRGGRVPVPTLVSPPTGSSGGTGNRPEWQGYPANERAAHRIQRVMQASVRPEEPNGHGSALRAPADHDQVKWVYYSKAASVPIPDVGAEQTHRGH